MRFSMRQIGDARSDSLRSRAWIRGHRAIACSERTNPGVLLYDVSVRNVSWQVRMPSVIECAEPSERTSGRSSCWGRHRVTAPHYRAHQLAGRARRSCGQGEFYELELSGRMYRAYPVSLGQRGCHLPIYEVCNPEDDTLGDQIAVAKVRERPIIRPRPSTWRASTAARRWSQHCSYAMTAT